MRWETLFADLEAQLNGEAARGRTAEIQEMVSYERSQVPMAGRLVAWVGQEVDLVTLGGQRFSGVLRTSGSGWVALRSGALEYIVFTGAIRSIEGRGQRVGSTDRARISLRLALRAIARDRSAVTIFATDGEVAVTGTIDYVGTDFLQVAVHAPGELPERGAITARQVLPLAAVAVIQRRS
ncbi:hypothetical protein [Zhihengliuella halotolerans]|uniref:Uncharacterized protein n=1 Tax=Zhihengliuella halotolerans TaxID=370736 RepID=A0A4Q8AAR3_9MICC|nr:hypothetical protein [Zhihengliuella halotolerans]RZU61084.1 hypothetical protein EV380_0641 [Zhihengliuella halotolerans]